MHMGCQTCIFPEALPADGPKSEVSLGISITSGLTLLRFRPPVETVPISVAAHHPCKLLRCRKSISIMAMARDRQGTSSTFPAGCQFSDSQSSPRGILTSQRGVWDAAPHQTGRPSRHANVENRPRRSLEEPRRRTDLRDLVLGDK